MYIRNLGRMTKMASMPIFGKNPSKIFFSRTSGPISTKLGMKHQWLKHYIVYMNLYPVMTLTYFMARSTQVAIAFEWEKLLKCHLKKKSCRKWAVGLNINDSEKKNGPQGLICPHPGAIYMYITIIFKRHLL